MEVDAMQAGKASSPASLVHGKRIQRQKYILPITVHAHRAAYLW